MMRLEDSIVRPMLGNLRRLCLGLYGWDAYKAVKLLLNIKSRTDNDIWFLVGEPQIWFGAEVCIDVLGCDDDLEKIERALTNVVLKTYASACFNKSDKNALKKLYSELIGESEDWHKPINPFRAAALEVLLKEYYSVDSVSELKAIWRKIEKLCREKSA